ncbi:MAG TPA: plasmid stabilization protein [Lichenihabitans sp.]|jgi:plasmid stability protein|nr:plasmid stabilization protein [Lichenihabitans sp.]
MPAVTIRNLSDELHRALKQRAKNHGRSTEAEIRDILKQAVDTDHRLKVGSALEAFGRRYGGLDLDLAHDQTPTMGADFD